jgi:hypothetical protein
MKKIILVAGLALVFGACKKKFNYECNHIDTRTGEYSAPFYPGKMTSDYAAIFAKQNTYSYTWGAGKTYRMICNCRIVY